MKGQSKIFKLSFGAMFVALTAIGANITTMVPFLVIGGVPITLQTFFAILAGLVLGRRLGAFTMFVYMALGLVGAPIFAQFKGGLSVLFSPTFGFIVSYIIVAYVSGWIIEHYPKLSAYVVSALIGLTINYVIGTHWMYMAYQLWFEAPGEFSYRIAWLWMVVPLPKDIVLAALAGAFAYRLKHAGVYVTSLAK